MTARNVADVQKAIEKIFPLVYEFRKPKVVTDVEKVVLEEEEYLDEEEPDSDNEEFFFDPETLQSVEPPNKKRKTNDSSHLTKKYKGPQKIRKARRPLGKDNESKEDRMNVSDGEFDTDDPENSDFWTNTQRWSWIFSLIIWIPTKCKKTQNNSDSPTLFRLVLSIKMC